MSCISPNLFSDQKIKNGFKEKWIFKGDNPSSNSIDGRYKELYQITKPTSLEDFQEQQQLKWTEHVTIMKNNDIIKKLTFHSTLSKRFGSKLLSILEKVIMMELRRKNFPENCFYKFYSAVTLDICSMNAKSFLNGNS